MKVSSQGPLGRNAFEVFNSMQLQRLPVTKYVYPKILSACTNLSSIQRTHALIIKTGLEWDVYIASTLVHVYGKCGYLENARQVFDKMPQRNVVSWTAMMVGCVHAGYAQDALQMYQEIQIQEQTIRINSKCFAIVLSACAHLQAMQQGMQLHVHIIKTGFHTSLSVGNGLVSVYAKCGNTRYTCKVFDEMDQRDLVSWNAVISGYTHSGKDKEALQYYCRMQQSNIEPDSITLSSVVSSCASLEGLEQGKQIHAKIIQIGFEPSVSVGNSLITMYARSGSMEDSIQVFKYMSQKDLTSWNAVVGGYVQGCQFEKAIELFNQMHDMVGEMNHITFATILGAFNSPQSLIKGMQLHAHLLKAGFAAEAIVRNALLTMYADCGSIDNASNFFSEMPKEDVVSWNAMIAGYTQNGLGKESLKLFSQMHRIGIHIKPDNFTFATTLTSCASLATLENGKQVHASIMRTGFYSDIFVDTALVDMYAKCGSIEDAEKVFNSMFEPRDFSWNTMIAGYARHGYADKALKIFFEMQEAGLKPDHITFVNVLSACSHTGLVDEARSHFDSMKRNYGITPRVEHYACMVDILGRCGFLDEAESFIKKMPLQPSALIWRILLGACRVHGNLDIGKRAAECVLELEPQDAATHLLLQQIYATGGNWDDVAKVRTLIKNLEVKKEPGCSWIEINNRVYVFVAESRRSGRKYQGEKLGGFYSPRVYKKMGTQNGMYLE
ncbi:putative pentatricopeptide repeat-containing protein At5g09950 [Cryptomeria japonica]|uniref:putative pentatricopeptide repeat-containing protein At5g09950 n=1 Tax=Cryptomeria japonica TaxID=3369 RepID=UPI0027DA4057|nr:putative pentatricopeptide repeat-containing protein At5g09950 [Cryptomeria japonica]